MASDRIETMATSFRYTMISMYLDNPGTGEFDWETIYKNLTDRRRTNLGYTVYFVKSDFKDNIADIIRCLREENVNIARKRVGDTYYYKIVNIQDVINRQNTANRLHFQTPIKNSERWLGGK